MKNAGKMLMGRGLIIAFAEGITTGRLLEDFSMIEGASQMKSVYKKKRLNPESASLDKSADPIGLQRENRK